MEKIAFFLPVLPDYRKDFFEQLSDIVKAEYELTVFHGNSIGIKKEIINTKENKFLTKSFQSKSFKFLGFHLIWIKNIIKETIKYKPNKVVLLFNPGVINFALIIIFCVLTNKEWYIWSCGFERNDLNSFQKVLRKIMLKIFYNNAKGIITYGHKFAESLEQQGINNKKIIVAQNTINIEKIIERKRIEKSEARKIIGIEHDVEMFLFVGALIKTKNLDKAVNIFAEVIKENSSVCFFIIGSGKEYESLNSLINKIAMKKNIILVPGKYNDELEPYFCAADVFILTGTGGLAINEAMAYSLPVISTIGDGTVLDIVNENENGFILKNDLINMKEKIYKWLDLSESDKNKMSNKSKELILQKGTLKNMVERFAMILLN